MANKTETLYFKYYIFASREEAEEELHRWCNENGWIDVMIEAGYLSPDGSSIIYYGRQPYIGRFMQYDLDKTQEFYELKANLKRDKIILEG